MLGLGCSYKRSKCPSCANTVALFLPNCFFLLSPPTPPSHSPFPSCPFPACLPPPSAPLPTSSPPICLFSSLSYTCFFPLIIQQLARRRASRLFPYLSSHLYLFTVNLHCNSELEPWDRKQDSVAGAAGNVHKGTEPSCPVLLYTCLRLYMHVSQKFLFYPNERQMSTFFS